MKIGVLTSACSEMIDDAKPFVVQGICPCNEEMLADSWGQSETIDMDEIRYCMERRGKVHVR